MLRPRKRQNAKRAGLTGGRARARRCYGEQALNCQEKPAAALDWADNCRFIAQLLQSRNISPPAGVVPADWRLPFMADTAVATVLGPHGAKVLPAAEVDSYNLELKDDDGFVGDRASRQAFHDILEKW